MAFLESKLRSSDFPYSAMQNMYDANRNADLERQMMMMQLAREKEKMRQERMRTNKLSEEKMRGTGDAPKAQDPMAMSAQEQQMYDKYDWMGRPSDAVKAINLVQARGQDPNVARQVGAGTIANMRGLAGRGMMAQAQAPMEPDVMSPEYQQQLLANRMGQQGLAGYMGARETAEAAQQLAEAKAQGYVDSAEQRKLGDIEIAKQRAQAAAAKNAPPSTEERITDLIDKKNKRLAVIADNIMRNQNIDPADPSARTAVLNAAKNDPYLLALKKELEALQGSSVGPYRGEYQYGPQRGGFDPITGMPTS